MEPSHDRNDDREHPGNPPANSNAVKPPRPVSSDVPEPEHREQPPRKPAGKPPAANDRKGQDRKREADRDEVLRESFPASDPPPVSPGSQ